MYTVGTTEASATQNPSSPAPLPSLTALQASNESQARSPHLPSRIESSIPLGMAFDSDHPRVRKKFAAIDDVILFKAVNYFRPWESAIGTSSGIMKVFEDIAEYCRRDPLFAVKKPGTALRTRFTKLVENYRSDQCQSMRQSGTVEQYEKREMLLQDIITLMNDWKEKDAERKEEKSARQRGIESSGALLRRLAMRDFESEDSDSDKVNDSESLLNKTTPRSAASSSTTSPETTTASTASNTKTKRAKQDRSGRKKKITKRDQLGAVTGALNLAILEAGEEDKAKYEYKTKRLEFKREQQEEERRHESIEAEKRRDHEIRIEERRLKAEDKREKRMHDFLLKILTHKNQDSN